MKMTQKRLFFSIATIKAHLSRALQDVAQGKEVIITDHNRPVARLLSLEALAPLPDVNLKSFFQKSPFPLAKGALKAAELVREIRESEEH